MLLWSATYEGAMSTLSKARKSHQNKKQ